MRTSKGNIITVALLSTTLFISAFFVEWGSVTIQAKHFEEEPKPAPITAPAAEAKNEPTKINNLGDAFGAVFGAVATVQTEALKATLINQKITMNASNGVTPIGSIEIPFFASIVTGLVCVILAVLNGFSITSISKRIPQAGLALVIIFMSINAYYLISEKGTIGIGLISMVIAAATGIYLAQKSTPRGEPVA